MKIVAVIALIACITIGCFLAKGGEFKDEWTWDDTAEARKSHAQLEGKPMPALQVADWINGEVKPEAIKGKVVLIDFFTTWCDSCIEAIPHNNEMAKKYKDQGLVVVGVCTADDQDKLEKLAKEKGIEYPVAKDPGQKSETAWHVTYYPTYALIDRSGTVRIIGLQTPFVERVVQKLLAEKE